MTATTDGHSGMSAQEAAELLRWYQDIGVDIALEEQPVDRFAESAALAAERAAGAAERKPPRPAPGHMPVTSSGGGPAPSPADRAAGRFAGVPPTHAPGGPGTAGGGLANAAIPDDKAVESARELAASVETLDALRQAMERFEGCNLRLTAKNTVFADGNPQAKVMLIGEAPGRDEDLQGLPFVGRSGQLLDRMLAAIGLDRSSVYITNVLAWRPPGNRNPTPAETEICRPFIERHIELVDPEVIVFVGAVSAKLMLKTTDGILKLRGKWKTYSVGERQYDAIAMLHPAFLLRQPAQKRSAWQDMLKLQARLEKTET